MDRVARPTRSAVRLLAAVVAVLVLFRWAACAPDRGPAAPAAVPTAAALAAVPTAAPPPVPTTAIEPLLDPGGRGELRAVVPAGAAAPIRLSITPVGVEGSYFTLTASPGERRPLTVQLGNVGTSTVRARTYPADAYTIVNGGFDAALAGEPASGTTTWLDYPDEVLGLAAGATVQRPFTLAVPADATPGEYLTSLVIQNAEPVAGDGATSELNFAFRQVIRQVIAVSITVPGPQVPGLEIGAVTHRTVAGTSSIAVAVKNTGNVRLKPAGEFVLRDDAGKEVSRYPVSMDSFYAGTQTFIEVPFAQRLNPGVYSASLSLTDATATGVAVSSDALAVIVPTAAAETGTSPQPIGTVAVPQPAAVDQAAPTGAAAHVSGAWPAHPIVWVLGGTALLVVLLGAGIGLGLTISRRSLLARGAADHARGPAAHPSRRDAALPGPRR